MHNSTKQTKNSAKTNKSYSLSQIILAKAGAAPLHLDKTNLRLNIQQVDIISIHETL